MLAYDPESQKRFWESLGIVDWRGLLAWLGGLLGVFGTVAAVAFWPRRKSPSDAEVRAYDRFLKKLRRRGLAKATGEGPLDFSRRAAEAQPVAGPDIERITALYLALRYGRSRRSSDLESLRRLVRSFRIPR